MREPHVCQCQVCHAGEDEKTRQDHERINLLVSRLDEQQRRWYVAVESMRIGHGGDLALWRITGIDAKTIRRGRLEMEARLEGRPTTRQRLPGGGRPRAEKKTQD